MASQKFLKSASGAELFAWIRIKIEEEVYVSESVLIRVKFVESVELSAVCESYGR